MVWQGKVMDGNLMYRFAMNRDDAHVHLRLTRQMISAKGQSCIPPAA